jgi:eukaryotic-like serine/threonine-protein kinase
MPDVTPLQAGDRRRVGRYRLTGRLASWAGPDGGPPPVFMARTTGGDPVLVTLLGRARVADAAARDRFTAEARVARRVSPSCATRVLDAGIEGDDPYLVTEYVPGPTLAEVVTAEGALPAGVLEAVAIGTATGLTAIHQAGLVHGKFGPGQVILGPGGPRVTHFGITPPYGPATPAADLLAWAQTVMFAAVGRPPVGPQDLAGLPPELRAVVAACLMPDPDGRPTTRAVLARLLGRRDGSPGLLAEGTRQARAAARAPDSGPVPRPRERTRLRSRSSVAAWAMACAVCVVAIVAGAVYIARPHRGAAVPGTLTAGTPGGNATRLPRPLPSASPPEALTGNWSGPVHQTGPVLTVTVRISLPADSPTGTIAYPALGCSGRLAIVSVATRLLTLDQIITRGQKKCASGVVTLSPGPAGTAVFIFLRPGGNNPAGTLTRPG